MELNTNAISVRNNDLDIVRKLTQAKADANFKHKSWAGLSLIELASSDAISILIAANVCVNTSDTLLREPILHAKCNQGNLEAVQSLISANADLNITNKYGQTALINVVENRRIDPGIVLDTVRILIGARCDVRRADKNGNTALMIADKAGNEEVASAIFTQIQFVVKNILKKLSVSLRQKKFL